jgi:hypothetical protein
MKKIIYLLIILVGLAGCVRQPGPTSPVEPARSVESAAPSPSPFPTATRTHTATPEPKPPTETATATATRLPPTHLPPTVTATPNDAVTFTQLQELQGLPETVKIPGSIVLAAFEGERTRLDEANFRQITIWNMETNKQENLLSGKGIVSDISVSPDGQWLKYTKKKFNETDNRYYPASLHIASVDGREQKMIPWDMEWGPIAQWLDQEHLVVRRKPEGDDSRPSTFTAKWVLNPFSGTLAELPEYPEVLYDEFPQPDWNGNGMVSYNSDLSSRIYITWKETLILEDLNTQAAGKVAFIYWPFTNNPCWSPSGQEFGVAATLEGKDMHYFPLHFELYRVSVEGTVTQLTDMFDQFDRYTIRGECAWSPDGKKIAFWLDTKDAYNKVDSGQANLAIVDVDRNQVKIFSLESSYASPQRIVWSPDGQRLLLGIVQYGYPGVSTVLVDLAEGWVAHIADDMTPMGWMVNKP